MGGEGPAGAPAVSDVEADLMVLLQHESGRGAQPLLEALLDKRSDGDSLAVQEAADRLLRTYAPRAVDLAASAATLIQTAGDERSQRLFVTSCLQRDGRSQGQLGREEGVSATRVGRMIHGAERGVRAALGASTGSLPWAVRSLRRQLGGVTTDGRLDSMLPRLGAGEPPAAQLLPWLAGPYVPVPGHPGWLVVESGLVFRTKTCLRTDGGVRRLTDVQADLADLEVDGQQLVPWLQANGATVIHDLAVVVAGPLADAVERVLDAHGVPRSAEEIAVDLAGGGRTVDLPSLSVAIRQRRFARVGGAVRLVAWPEEKQPAVKPRRQRRADRGRQPDTYPVPGAKKPSVKEREHPPFRDNRLWLWVRVDPDVLRGCEAAVPVALVEGLGLTPLTRCTFSSRWGPVTLGYDGPQPTRGSVRAIALAVGARSDDTLFLGFSGSSQDVAVHVRHGSAITDIREEASIDGDLFHEIATGGPR